MAMLQIGSVQFQALGPGYTQLSNSARFNWPAQGRFGRRDALQFTGEGEETVEVRGRIYTDYQPGFRILAQLKRLARTPQMVVSGAGDILGKWVILEVSNEQSFPNHRGEPAKVEFTISLSLYGDDGGGFNARLF